MPHLHFCVGCGADRQAVPSSPGLPSGPQTVTAVRGELVPPTPVPTTAPGRGHPAPPTWHAPAPDAWNTQAPAGRPQSGLPEWQAPASPDWQAPASPELQLPPGQDWHPEPVAPRSSPAPWLIALSVLVVLLLSASAALVTLRPELVGMGSGGSGPVVTPSPTTAPVTPQPVPPTPTLSAHEELTAQADSDRSQVEAVTDRWVPQLSSKKPGTVDAGVTYDDDSILTHYRGLAARYPGTALLWSGDWPVFKMPDYWVVISTQSFATAAEANGWCDAQGLSRNDCFAKKLSHSGGTAGTTVPR